MPAPEVRARVGYYGPDHVARLRLIIDLQADGFNLTAIERLLSGSDGLAERLLGLRKAVTTPFEAESPELITAEELLKRFGEVDAKDAERIRKLRLLVPLGDDRFEVPSPALLQAAEEVLALGISLHAALSLVERVSRDCESISRRAQPPCKRKGPASGALPNLRNDSCRRRCCSFDYCSLLTPPTVFGLSTVGAALPSTVRLAAIVLFCTVVPPPLPCTLAEAAIVLAITLTPPWLV